ncbi:Uncharacterised protein [Escherichia coli]|nr:Uncharacterised protein [Escherichia coli]SRA39829.1 Uncharacterised protein [Escherichia coli]SRB21846.1 Uncharacterised protein [Escherichia coli]
MQRLAVEVAVIRNPVSIFPVRGDITLNAQHPAFDIRRCHAMRQQGLLLGHREPFPLRRRQHTHQLTGLRGTCRIVANKHSCAGGTACRQLVGWRLSVFFVSRQGNVLLVKLVTCGHQF